MSKRNEKEKVVEQEAADPVVGGLVSALTGDAGDAGQADSPDAPDAPEEVKQVIRLDPENVIIDERLRKLRRWNGESRQEGSIAELSRLIVEEGQKQPAVLWETADGYVLVAGQRRREAVMLARQNGEDTMLECVVDPNITDFPSALRAALMENVQRENFTDVEFMHNISAVREELGKEYQGKAGTARVADYFGVHPATITQMERLKKLPEDVLADVQEGRLTGAAALELVSVQEQVGEGIASEVQAKAVAKARVEAEIKGKKAEKKAKAAPVEQVLPMTKEQKAVAKRVTEAAKLDREKAAKAAPVQAKHVRAAAKEIAGDKIKTKAPKMGELCTFFDGLTGADQPKAMAGLAKAISDYGHGKVGVKKLQAAWDDVGFMLPVEDEDIEKQLQKRSLALTPRKKTDSAGKKAAAGKKPVGKTVKAKGKKK